MKRIALMFLLSCHLFYGRSLAQSAEAQQLLLNVEKLAQFKKILSNMKKGYQVVSKGYNTVKELSQGNFNLHDAFLNALLEVSPAVKKYQKVTGIIQAQASILSEYRSAFRRFKSCNLFNVSELQYMEAVYRNLFKSSLQNLDELGLVITTGKLRMNDEERLAAIDRIYGEITDKLIFLRNFNNEGKVLAIQRGRELVNTRLSKKMAGF